MTWINNDFTAFHWTGQDPNKDVSIDVVMTEFDYDKAARLQFVAVRPFSREFKTDSNAIILNESAINLIGYKDPIGKTMRLGDQPLTIIRVIKNVVARDPFKPVGACAILFNSNNVHSVLIRLKDHADLCKSLDATKPIVEKYNPAFPFDYFFEDEEFGKEFATENKVAKLAGIFAGLAIFISCLGLLGLAMFMTERRSKEVSIRKVFGASFTNLWLLLSLLAPKPSKPLPPIPSKTSKTNDPDTSRIIQLRDRLETGLSLCFVKCFLSKTKQEKFK